tara:strand:- start:803 stop:1435 length:633 start_codon:yes stop_codon:yes gene_type:complete
MAKHYFREVPNIRYKSPLKDSNSGENFILAKNLFLRAKIRDDLLRDATFLKSYIVNEGERPMDVAEAWYGAPQYDWIVLITSGIINVRTEWPMSSKVLYNYCENKYGNDLNATQFYETTEVKDAQGRLIMPAGKVVDSNFTIQHPDTHNITLNPVIGISNYLVETRENEKKRNIKLMRPEYLTLFLSDLRESMKYSPSSQYESKNIKKAT